MLAHLCDTDVVQALHMVTMVQGSSEIAVSLPCRYSVSDEQGSRMKGSCLHNMHLAAGDVHLWWLFPEDVGPISTLMTRTLYPLVSWVADSLYELHGLLSDSAVVWISLYISTLKGIACCKRVFTGDVKAPADGILENHLQPEERANLVECIQVTDKQLLRSYEGLLTAEEHAHMMEGSTPAVRKERLLARVLVRTTLSRCAHHTSFCQELLHTAQRA